MTGTKTKAAAPADTNALVQGNNAFAFDLYARLRTAPGNLFFSPYSISSCLAMTYAGARGATATQMARVLHFTDGQAQVNAAFARLQADLAGAEKQQGIELNIANALWAQQAHPFLPGFMQTAQKEYGAKVQPVDFRRHSQIAARDINQWVAEKTKNRISQIVSPDALGQMTRLVLVNAIYFKGAWATPFRSTATRPMPFHASASRQQDAQFMSRTEMMNYIQNDLLEAIELPYEGGALSMVILLPREIEGCSKVEESLTAENLATWLKGMRRTLVELYVPRFKMEAGYNLNGSLASMGMGDTFSDRADFSGMDGARDLFISSVFHKAWVEVNEQGTEAAAATSVTIRATAVRRQPERPPVFRADHPFVFLVRETGSGSVLFVGRMSEPKT